MKKIIIVTLFFLSTSCSLIDTAKYRYGMRKEQNRLYDNCLKDKLDKYYCHERSINDMIFFEEVLKSKAKM